MRTLVFWGGGSPGRARALAAEGATLLLWRREAAETLEATGLAFLRPLDVLTPEDGDAVDEAAMAWTKAFGRASVADGQSLRELCRRGSLTLWWFAEIHLHYSTSACGRVRLIEAVSRILDSLQPGEVTTSGLSAEEAVLIGRTATARGVLFHGPARVGGLPYAVRTLSCSLKGRLNTAKTLAAALKATLAGKPPGGSGGGRRLIVFLSHAAFWRARRDPGTGAEVPYEHYFDALIPGVSSDPGLEAFVVGVGPRTAFRRRRLADRLGEWLRVRPPRTPYVPMSRYTSWAVLRGVLSFTGEIRRTWRRLRALPGMLEAFSHRGVRFADVSGPDLASTLLLQLPWAVRSYEEVRELLSATRPAALCLYAESSGWGRVALAACREAGVPTVAIQHGILYPKYYAFRHDADEGECPRPDKTALFGEAARRILLEIGRYRPEALVLTGSPTFDEILRVVRTLDRDALRARLGVSGLERLVVVASRHAGIRETHQAIGSAFPALLRAAESLGVHLLVKPHPAEPQGAYDRDLRASGAGRARVLPSSQDLLELLLASDVLVTVESLSAVEALVVGRPVLVLNMPTNLKELVEAGAALGVPGGGDPLPALRALLEDPRTGECLEDARRAYLSHVALGVDGGATRRILDLIRETASGAGRGRVEGR